MPSLPQGLPSWCRRFFPDMRRFFNADNFLWRWLGIFGDFVLLSLLWTVFSLPLVTLGPASAALYDAAVHVLRRGEGVSYARFFASFRRELKQGTVLTLAWVLPCTLLWLVFRALPGSLPLQIAAVLLSFFLLGFLCWLYAALSRFRMRTAALLVSSLRLALGHSLRSAGMALVWGAAISVSLRFAAPFFLCPALAAYISSYLIEPVFILFEDEKEQGM